MSQTLLATFKINDRIQPEDKSKAEINQKKLNFIKTNFYNFFKKK